jgi:hypothetical protein
MIHFREIFVHFYDSIRKTTFHTGQECFRFFNEFRNNTVQEIKKKSEMNQEEYTQTEKKFLTT